MADCKHENFDGHVTVVRNNDNTRFRIDVKIHCEDCGLPFRFEKGYIASTDGLELNVEIKPGPREVNQPLAPLAIKEMASWSAS